MLIVLLQMHHIVEVNYTLKNQYNETLRRW